MTPSPASADAHDLLPAASPADAARSGLYALLAGWLLAPDAWALEAVRRLLPWTEGDDSRLARAWHTLAQRCAHCTPQALASEHAQLFIAAGNPAVDPYQSRYFHGCLMDRSLAALRSDLRALGLVRSEGLHELEDHLGALCESMQLLIHTGQPPQRQAWFFERHLAGWYAACLDDIAQHPQAQAYRDFAALARAFLDEEAQVLRLEQDEPEPADPAAPTLTTTPSA